MGSGRVPFLQSGSGHVGTRPAGGFMTINIQGFNPFQQASSVAASDAVGAVSTSPSSAPSAIGSGSSTATISSPAQLFSELQQLSQSDPTEFKAVASQLATSFQQAASQSSGPDAKVLGNLANMFTQAAQTGQLQAPQGAQGGASAGAGGAAGASGYHHHHHHGGGGGGGGGAIEQAFQSAASILDQALEGPFGSSSSSSASSASTSSSSS
jgi:hypothetical protein